VSGVEAEGLIGGPIPIPNPISQPYWDGTKLGELRVRECNACGAHFRFIRELCPQCWSDDLGWKVSAGRGRVVARVVVQRAPYPAMEARVPYVLALVELEEGVTMMSNIVDCDPTTVEVGLAVELTWEERGDFMLPQFKPA
jgi:uncharacterized protein